MVAIFNIWVCLPDDSMGGPRTDRHSDGRNRCCRTFSATMPKDLSNFTSGFSNLSDSPPRVVRVVIGDKHCVTLENRVETLFRGQRYVLSRNWSCIFNVSGAGTAVQAVKRNIRNFFRKQVKAAFHFDEPLAHA
jgi:hypothetical protein